MPPKSHHPWNFDIDRFLNPIVPSPPWKHLPYPLAHFLGYRKTKPVATGNLMPTFWAFIGIFCAITIIQVVSIRIPSYKDHHVPAIVGSFGATAVLEFYAIESPLAQPRNTFFGQVLSSVVGVAVAKLFLLSDRFDDIQYLGGAIACAAATSIMALTKTVHPPAGATALLAVVDSRLVDVGWFLIPVMILSCALMICVALLVNNLERRFPSYWWTPEALRKQKPVLDHVTKPPQDDPEAQRQNVGQPDAAERTLSEKDTEAVAETPPPPLPEESVDEISSSTENFSRRERKASAVIIKPGDVIVPENMYLTQEEMQLLETLSKRL